MTWLKDWLKTSADRLAANLREFGWPSSSDPVVNPEGTIQRPYLDPPEAINETTCTHPGISIHRFPNGDTIHQCARCMKQWGSLMEAIDDAEQIQPINVTESYISPVVMELASEMASEMAFRLGQSIAVTPGIAVSIGHYEDFASMGHRQKAMEDAARAAAAAFDAGIEAERNPVKLDGDRKLKAI